MTGYGHRRAAAVCLTAMMIGASAYGMVQGRGDTPRTGKTKRPAKRRKHVPFKDMGGDRKR